VGDLTTRLASTEAQWASRMDETSHTKIAERSRTLTPSNLYADGGKSSTYLFLTGRGRHECFALGPFFRWGWRVS
jgi:hypothetical protein